MKVTADVEDLLKKLRENLELHGRIVEEARLGYITKARAAVASRLKLLMDGQPVNLQFRNLTPPIDYSDAYKLAIEMMEWHQNDTIVLDGEQVRHLIHDEWDWSSEFFLGNEGYSETASSLSGKYK